MYGGINLICQGLCIGPMLSVNSQQLQKNNITHVLSILNDFQPKGNLKNEYKFLIIDLLDDETQNISKHFEETYNFIDDCISNGGTVLVHCFAGISRSSTICIAYLMKKLRLPFEEALAMVREVRQFVEPNGGFVKQLKHFETQLGITPPKSVVVSHGYI
ncbi:putative protein tyrosine phosphatase [Tieghemostelium lacteum]|uniref:protein-tyrosine-phosphatase n=1 Tax=Tieghemostelium lacteum TaxID=361077 RepID=A0A152A967_TIELA|nr:putative protein tyrosine phosphatase [Tieghemostelium lacteum]|eukprot:KYR02772.1 putative protein tyrosine phosphatase [Tieghemostelium lacteum]